MVEPYLLDLTDYQQVKRAFAASGLNTAGPLSGAVIAGAGFPKTGAALAAGSVFASVGLLYRWDGQYAVEDEKQGEEGEGNAYEVFSDEFSDGCDERNEAVLRMLDDWNHEGYVSEAELPDDYRERLAAYEDAVESAEFK